MNSILAALLGLLIMLVPYVQGVVSMWLVRVITNAVTWADNLNMYVKQLVVVGVNMGLAKLALLLGLAGPLTFTGLHDPTVLLGAIGAAFAMIIHAAVKRKESAQIGR